MKNPLFLLLFLASFSSCKKEISEPTELPQLQITSILDFFPENTYEAYSKAIFTNEEGEEKELKIEYSKSIISENEIEGVDYSAEQIIVNLSHSIEEETEIELVISANYIDTESHQQTIDINYFSSEGFIIPNISLDSEGSTLFCDFFEEKELLDTSFFNLYQNTPFDSPTLNSISELYYNATEGIFAFREKNTILWILDRYEM